MWSLSVPAESSSLRAAATFFSLGSAGKINGSRWLKQHTIVSTGSRQWSTVAVRSIFPALGSTGSSNSKRPRSVTFSQGSSASIHCSIWRNWLYANNKSWQIQTEMQFTLTARWITWGLGASGTWPMNSAIDTFFGARFFDWRQSSSSGTLNISGIWYLN